MNKRFMKHCIILASIFICNTVFALDKNLRLTPFTGTDFVRIVVDDTFQQATGSTFKTVIRSLKDKNVLWQGPVKLVPVADEGKKTFSFTIDKLSPQLWSPSSPYLYEIVLEQYNKKKLVNTITERLGFRSFESRNGNLFLNNKPIFLRGFAINPPNRGIPSHIDTSREFALEYVSFIKSLNVNIIRIPDNEVWYDVCDELGMMVFGGNYSGSAAKGAKVENFEQVGDETDGGFPKDYDKGVAWYKHNKLGPIAHHPSLMVYAMTNETPFAGKRAIEWEKFLSYNYDKLKKWDETRVYIANAGYGYGKVGDICDLHRYWGWYYSSPYTFLHTRDNSKIVPFPKRVQQPITFTETIGNYTGPDGRYNLTPNHKNPGSQLAWTGHERQDLQANLADEHQIFTIKQAVEIVRRLRIQNHELSGIFPFTILFYNWETIKKFADMNPKPAAQQLKASFQPVLLSWECWTPQIYSGSSIKAIAHVVNDDDEGRNLKNAVIVYQISDKTYKKIYTDSVKIPDVAYYATHQQTINIKLPDHIATGDYQLTGKIVSSGKIISENSYKLFIADKLFSRSAPSPQSKILLYDPAGHTARSFKTLGIAYESLENFKNLPLTSALVIGENAADNTVKINSNVIKNYISKGGRVLCFRQDSVHLPNVNTLVEQPFKSVLPDIDNPEYPSPVRPSRNGYYVNSERQEHPVMFGIQRRNLQVWSDYTGWNETKENFPAIYPVTDGFIPVNKASLGSITILCNYGSGLEGVALAEQFNGKGSLLLSGFDLARRTGIDPIADRLFLNLVAYNATKENHDPYPVITNTIIWGDYETEKGILTGINSGLMLNSTPRIPEIAKNKTITITEKGDQFAPGIRVGWASRPGLQYVANGRRPFGPYYLRGFGAMPEILDKKTVEGEGVFWCRVLPGVNTAHSKVWNPDKKALTIYIQINDQTVTKEIQPNSIEDVACPVNAENIKMSFKGNRKLVILETAFINKKELNEN